MTRCVRKPAVDFLDDVHCKYPAVGFAREFVGAVARTHRHGQGVDAALGDELLGFNRIGE